MIRFRAIAEAMKTRLEEIPELRGRVVVFRRSNIDTEFDKRMVKTRGKAVIIRSLGGQNRGGVSKTSVYSGTFTVTLFTVPLLTQKDVKDADDLMTEIEAKLQGWWPESVTSNRSWWLVCEGVAYLEDPSYSVANLTVRAPGNLTS